MPGSRRILGKIAVPNPKYILNYSCSLILFLYFLSFLFRLFPLGVARGFAGVIGELQKHADEAL